MENGAGRRRCFELSERCWKRGVENVLSFPIQRGAYTEQTDYQSLLKLEAYYFIFRIYRDIIMDDLEYWKKDKFDSRRRRAKSSAQSGVAILF